MILAVMSYPKHYHISQLAIKRAIKHIPNIKEICIVWDDTHPEKPSTPLAHAARCGIPCYTFPWSAVIEKSNHPIDGWIGQQIIKLHLDRVLKNEIVILDGDLIINQDLDPKNITYASALPRYHPKYKHIDEMLGFGAYDFGSCPFMYVQADWLKNIRELCKTYSHSDIIDRLIPYLGRTNTLNEWEIIANYVFKCLKLPRRIEYFNRKAVKTDYFSKEYNDIDNFVLDGADDLPAEFWAKHNIVVDTNLTKALGYKNC